MNEEKSWISELLNFASICRMKMILSVIFSVLSVFCGFIPFYGMFRILKIFFEPHPIFSTVLFWCLISMAGYLLKLLFFAISTILSHLSAYRILETIRLEIVEKMMRAPLGIIMNKPIGNIKNIFVDRVEAVEPPLAHLIPELTGNILIPISIFIFLLFLDWRMALASLLSIILGIIPFKILSKNFKSKYDHFVKANEKVNSIIVEYIEGIEVVKAFNQTTLSYEKFSKAVNSFKDYTLAWYKSTWKCMYFAFSLIPSTLLGSLPIGLLLYSKGFLSVAELCLCLILSLSIVAPLTRIEAFMNELKIMEYNIKETLKVLNLPELKDSESRVELDKFDIKLNDVSFSYSGKREEDVIHDISLDLPQSSFTALVGPSGGGKSTIARLISRFWDVSGGSINIGGIDIRNIPLKQLSNIVSFVTQDNFLFNCSIKENIRLGNPDADDNEIYEAAEAACCNEFILKLDKGYDTPAGEAGKRLSGGEKQRIAIARAILKKAPIVILDEATAFTDPENENKIQQSIKALTKGKTLIVIAHRLSTIKNADQIVVLNKGQIIAKGTQSELLKNSEVYASMWRAHINAKSWAISSEGERNV